MAQIDAFFFFYQDSYCKVTVGAQTFCTQQAKDAGKNPSWTETLTFRRMGETMADLKIYDKDYGKDDYVCEGNAKHLWKF